MAVLDKIAFYQGRQDEVPNQELAKELAAACDQIGVAEIARNLWNENPAIQADCIKVMYEIGYLAPALISGYSADFLRLLTSKNNRLVWGGMIALAAIAAECPGPILAASDRLIQAMEAGSVITVDNGVKALAQAAAKNPSEARSVFAYLLHHLETCRAKEVPQHAESTAIAVTVENQGEFVRVLEFRLPELSETQVRRVRKVLRDVGKR